MRFDDHDLACLRRGLEHFRTGDYFAAHDDWEEVWQGLRGRQRLFWQAMIHLVVGMYHYTNGNLRGCRGQWHKALQKCDTLMQMTENAVPEPMCRLHEHLCNVLAAVEAKTDPLPAMTIFATEVVSEQWFEVT
jgi:hypothetical protein